MNNCKLVPIRTARNASADEPFQKELILRQVKKILGHPLFSGSGILRRFLLYIIQETLSGRTNTLKEYTIAIEVLNKPAAFNPRNNCVVRIHAGRLRNLLTTYYQEAGQEDDLIISMPKGRYIPSFLPTPSSLGLEPVEDYEYVRAKEIPDTVMLAVIPFKTFEKLIQRKAFTDSLGQIICKELNKLTKFALVSYHTTRQLSAKRMNVRSLAADFGVNYILTGDVQFEGDRIKVFVQLMDTLTRSQTWSEIYQVHLDGSNYFELSDYVATKITNTIRFLNIGLRHERFQRLPIDKVEVSKQRKFR
jgi:TolB-like protein